MNRDVGERSAEDADADADADTKDLARVIAANMTWYIEWPHVDGRFIAVFRTLPGYAPRDPS